MGRLMLSALLVGCSWMISVSGIDWPSPQILEALQDADYPMYPLDTEVPMFSNGRDYEHREDLDLPWDRLQYISGGSGKSSQLLTPSGSVESDTEIKTDEGTQAKSPKTLPKYCSPPNPCPKGYKPKDDKECQQQFFEDSEEFNKKLQYYQMSRGLCACDEEHMFNCPKHAATIGDLKDAAEQEDRSSLIEEFLSHYSPEDLVDMEFDGPKHETLVAKKSPYLATQKRSTNEEIFESFMEPAKKVVKKGDPNIVPIM